MKHFYSIFICLVLSISQLAVAENVITDPKGDWGAENERTITSTPKLSIDESFLYIYSEKQLDNATISIKDTNGNIIYSIVTTIPAYQTYSIPVLSLNNGEYTFSLHNGNKYIIVDISIDN